MIVMITDIPESGDILDIHDDVRSQLAVLKLQKEGGAAPQYFYRFSLSKIAASFLQAIGSDVIECFQYRPREKW